MLMEPMEYLEEERDAWRPYEALADLSDEQLERATPLEGPGHGWSARDLAGHLLAWQELVLQVAKELAVDEQSPTMRDVRRRFREEGDAWNAEMLAAWRSLPTAEVRQRLRDVPGELRGYLTVVPETRWIRNPDHSTFFLSNTTEHYEEHGRELAAVLEAVDGT